MAFRDGQTSVLLENVSKLIDKKVKGKQKTLVAQFATKLYKNMSNDDLVNRRDSDLYGAALSVWHSFNQKGVSDTAIRVFNPELSHHGWESNHTIIEIIVKDMPFLVDSVRIALSRLGLSPHLMLNSPIKLVRDEKGAITKLAPSSNKRFKATSTETVFLKS